MNRKLTTTELGRISETEAIKQEKISVCIVLENIRSLHNIGSFFRTADAFLIEKIYLAGYTACPPNREIEKTALGATKTVPWQQEQNLDFLYENLKLNGYKIVSIEQTKGSISLEQFQISKTEKYALVFGNEVKGVEEKTVKLSDFNVEIPQFGAKHSLNVSICGGIILWEFLKNKAL